MAHEPVGTLVMFSENQEELLDFVEQTRDELDKMGCEYGGPIPLERVQHDELDRFLSAVEDPDSEQSADAEEFTEWLFDVVKNEEHVEVLTEACESKKAVSARMLRVMGHEPIASILSRDIPQAVSLTAEIDEKPFGGGTGSLHTYNPSHDYVTEL